MQLKKLSIQDGKNVPGKISKSLDEQKNLSLKKNEDLKSVSQEFESLFLDTVLQSMRKSIVKSDFISGGHAEDMYQSMLDSEYAKMMSKQNQTGLARIIEKQLDSLSQAKSQHQLMRLKSKKAYSNHSSAPIVNSIKIGG